MSQPCTLGAAGRWLPPPRAAAAAPLRRLTHSPSRLPARLCFFPPPLPETLGVEAGACAVRWQPGALAQSPAGRPPHHHHPPPPPVHPGHRTPARTAGPPRRCAARSPSPPPSPPARAAPALSPSAPSPARGSGHAAAVAASGRAGGGGGSGSRSGSRPASPSAGRLGECQRRGGKEWRAGGRGGAPRCIPRVPLSPFPPGPGLPLRGRGLSPPPRPAAPAPICCCPSPRLPGPNPLPLSPPQLPASLPFPARRRLGPALPAGARRGLPARPPSRRRGLTAGAGGGCLVGEAAAAASLAWGDGADCQGPALR